MQRIIALACATSALQAPRATPARLRPVAAESEECIALGLETLNEVYAQWGVCVEESTAIKVGGLLFSPQDPRTYGTETVDGIVLTRNPGLGIELLEVANNNEGVGIVVVDGTVAGSSAADSALQKGDVIAFVGQPGGPFESVEAKTWDDTVDALGRVGGHQVELVVKSSDLPAAERYATTLVAAMRNDASFTDVRSSFEGGRPEVQVRVDRARASDLGVSARALATTTQILIGGSEVGTFEAAGRRYDVRVRLEEAQRQTPSQLALLQTRAASGSLVDIGQVADVGIATGPVQIDRQDRARKVSVLANAATGVALGQAVERVETLLAASPAPSGVSIGVEGQARRMAETGQAIGFAFLLALVALYIVLASQFDSFGQPVLIMLTAPLSFSGAFAALWAGGQEMSLFAQIGLLALMGIVMKNGILLVDLGNQRRDEGLGRAEAIASAAPERLRPVLMTALAAVFGMVPVAFATSDGSEWRNAMGFIIIGGLATSTLLTLVVVPAAYVIPDDAKRWVRRLRRIRSRAPIAAVAASSVDDDHRRPHRSAA